MTPREVALRALKQIADGWDFDAPARLLKNVNAENAVKVLPAFPYSIATNVAHADFWQQRWLARLEGHRAPGYEKDWHKPSAEEWPAVREAFLKNFERSIEIASREPFTHALPSDDDAIDKLLQIAVHDSYHLGQIKLIKRALRLSSPKRAPQE